MSFFYIFDDNRLLVVEDLELDPYIIIVDPTFPIILVDSLIINLVFIKTHYFVVAIYHK